SAEEVRRAIVRTGTGPVRGKLLPKLDHSFAHVHVDLLGPIFAAIDRAAANGQKPPAIVDMVIDMIDAGAATVITEPAQQGKSPEVVLAELYDQEQHLAQELAEAEADGGPTEYFREVLANCQNRIRAITREAV